MNSYVYDHGNQEAFSPDKSMARLWNSESSNKKNMVILAVGFFAGAATLIAFCPFHHQAPAVAKATTEGFIAMRGNFMSKFVLMVVNIQQMFLQLES